MRAKVTQAFPFSPDGISVVLHDVGDEVDGYAAVVAVREGWGESLDEPAAPENKAIPKAPKNKAR